MNHMGATTWPSTMQELTCLRVIIFNGRMYVGFQNGALKMYSPKMASANPDVVVAGEAS